jgi:hypothetical protein
MAKYPSRTGVSRDQEVNVQGYNEQGFCPECANSGGDHHPNCSRNPSRKDEPRTLQDAIARAENLRNFRKASPKRFESSEDYQDIVLLADEVERLVNALVELPDRIMASMNEKYPLGRPPL